MYKMKPSELAYALQHGTAPEDPKVKLCDAETVAEYLRPRFKGLRREAFWAIGVNPKNRPVIEYLVGLGTADSAPAHPREVFAPAMYAGAVSVLLAHNHPSGDKTPSRQDESLTTRMRDAGELLGVKLLDHLIITVEPEYNFYSFQQHGLL